MKYPTVEMVLAGKVKEAQMRPYLLEITKGPFTGSKVVELSTFANEEDPLKDPETLSKIKKFLGVLVAHRTRTNIGAEVGKILKSKNFKLTPK